MTNSYRTTVAEGLRRASHLIPFHAAGSSNLQGEYGAVCTPASTVPARFRDAQEERTAYYLSHTWEEGNRCKPDHAPRYWVTSYGVPIAWVTLDGRAHFADDETLRAASLSDWRVRQLAAMTKHRDAIRASWPARFAMNSEGDPVRNSTGQLLREDGLPAYRNPHPLRTVATA